jgi:hypothetical protein
MRGVRPIRGVRLRPDVAVAVTPDGAVLLDQVTGTYWQVNRTGEVIVSALLGGLTDDAITAELVRRFGIDEMRANQTVVSFGDKLADVGLALR